MNIGVLTTVALNFGSIFHVRNIVKAWHFVFAGTIICPTSVRHPPDALLKATAQHRRARSAAWSYRFPLNEEWCDLIVSFPTAILLHEVHIQPHTTGLSSKFCGLVEHCIFVFAFLESGLLKSYWQALSNLSLMSSSNCNRL